MGAGRFGFGIFGRIRTDRVTNLTITFTKATNYSFLKNAPLRHLFIKHFIVILPVIRASSNQSKTHRKFKFFYFCINMSIMEDHRENVP